MIFFLLCKYCNAFITKYIAIEKIRLIWYDSILVSRQAGGTNQYQYDSADDVVVMML